MTYFCDLGKENVAHGTATLLPVFLENSEQKTGQEQKF